jgi:TPR repeat protein
MELPRGSGSMYQHGQGVPEDLEKAVEHYKSGADLGDPLAHMSLATCYTHGRGVTQSYERAFHHHLQASESGLPVALYNVGGHYFAGKGVELSFKKAAEYYQQAADMGFAPAQVATRRRKRFLKASNDGFLCETVDIEWDKHSAKFFLQTLLQTESLSFFPCFNGVFCVVGEPWEHVLQWSRCAEE